MWIAIVVVTIIITSNASADRNYTVRPGDTLVRIARRFHTNIPALRRANDLRSDRLRTGARLRIPVGGSARSARQRGEHLVRAGDSLTVIARRHGVSLRELRRFNGLRGDGIRVGQRLRIPGRRRENRAPPVASRERHPSQEGADERAEALGLGLRRTARIVLGTGAEARWIEAANTAPLEVPEDARELDDTPIAPHTPAGTLRHPLDGERRHFMRGWGSGAGGYHLALDLYAPPGSEIRAAERGIVAYAGNGLSGYGRFVIIVHPNGQATAYAHTREMLVRAGELVAQGQVIALLGNTGLSRGPHLHFMLLHQGDHCDPAPLMRPLPQRRNGRELGLEGAVWPTVVDEHGPNEANDDGATVSDTSDERPVQCLPRSARPHPGHRRHR